MEDRFWSKVRRGGPDECWEWTAAKGSHGYGALNVGNGTIKLAHRIAWELTHGEIPAGLIVRHKCRGKCVNPTHLELGTLAENARDMLRDGTSTRGEQHGRSVLTNDQVRDIKRRLVAYERGMVLALAQEYGVTREAIGRIRTGKNWSWL